MKKLLLFIALVFAGFSASAQCVPDPAFTSAGVYPDSATGLPNACIDQAYSQIITNVVPVDTNVVIGGIPITVAFDSAVVVSWTGLPPGFTYACFDGDNVTSPVDQCAFEGGTAGCILVSGNPVAADIGSYQQIITVDAYVGGTGVAAATQIVDYYYIHVVDCSTSGLSSYSKSKFLVYPNPAKSVITLNGLNDIDLESVRIVDMAGNELAIYTGVTSPALDMNLDHLSNGMYFVEVNYNSTSEMIKFIKE